MKTNKQWLLIVPLLGILIFVALVKSKKAPVKQDIPEQSISARVVSIKSRSIVPKVHAFGVVHPEKKWEAVSEVSGKVATVHKELKTGGALQAGEQLLLIDPVDYELAIAETAAELERIDASIEEIQTRQLNQRNSLLVEQRSLELCKLEFGRQSRLVAEKSTSQSAMDQAELALQAQKQKILALELQLDLIPSELKLLDAQKKQAMAKLKAAKRNLERTRILMPFDGRLEEVNIQPGQFIKAGQQLFSAIGVQAVEIRAQLNSHQVLALLSDSPDVSFSLISGSQEYVKELGITAKIFTGKKENEMLWDATPLRFETSLQNGTRTQGLILRVENPYRGLKTGTEPALLPGMFVEVELKTKQREDLFLMPRECFQEGVFWVLDGSNRMTKRSPEIALILKDMIGVKKGFKAGEQVLISHVVPAVEGQLISPVEDKSWELALENGGER
jgi:RND family efflux transporter MFP subunit